MIDYISYIGFVAGILTIISLLPQIIKSWKTKSTKDISLLRYILYTSGLFLWFVYGFLRPDLPIAAMSMIGTILALSVVYLKLKYG